jgi:hypothetical protein
MAPILQKLFALPQDSRSKKHRRSGQYCPVCRRMGMVDALAVNSGPNKIHIATLVVPLNLIKLTDH